MDAAYDLVVVGAGVAGLHVALRYLEARPGSRVAVLEASDRVGGRLRTHRRGGTSYELGGGRFSPDAHPRTWALLKENGVEMRPIASAKRAIVREDGTVEVYDDVRIRAELEAVEAFARRLPRAELQAQTFGRLALRALGGPRARDLRDRFGYGSKFDTMSAYDALRAVRRDYFSRGLARGYHYAPGGADQLPRRMAARVRALGGEIRLGTPALEVRGGRVLCVMTTPRDGVLARRVVVALPAAAALRVIRPVASPATLRLLAGARGVPMVRAYAGFDGPLAAPFCRDDVGVATFAGSVLQSAKRAAGGAWMVPYSDSANADRWHRTGQAARAATLARAFGRRPAWTRTQFWDAAVHVWAAGSDSDAAARAAVRVSPRVHVCGEAFSQHQGWCEGAVETADAVVRAILGDLKGRTRPPGEGSSHS